MTGKWSNFGPVWALYIGTTMMAMPISMLLVQYFIHNGADLDNFSLAFTFGLPLGIIQMFFLGGRTLWLIVITVVSFYVGFLICTALGGYRLPAELGNPVVGAGIGLGFAVVQSFYVLRGTPNILTYVWMFTNVIGWAAGFWLTNEIGLALYQNALDHGADSINAIYPSTALAAWIGGAVAGLFIGYAFSWAHPKPDEYE